ncbi:MAG: Ethanolamine utilization protein EutQ [candidate division WS2 bacterium]|nr:Ethanolamine utilization protein EutQ [Candidatus Lithacetigena glycinireducens]
MIDKTAIEEIVKEVLHRLGETESVAGGPQVFQGTLSLPTFEQAGLGNRVRLLDLITDKHCPTIGAGLMEMENCSFPWTLNYDEIDYVIEGTLEIVYQDKTITGRAGDIIYIPKGSSIQFKTPDKVRFFYVVYPVNWAEQ